jgi:hypothetical protein
MHGAIMNGQLAFFLTTRGGDRLLPGWRDPEYRGPSAGRFTAEKRAAAESRGDKLSNVFFHAAWGVPISIGCQTLASLDFMKFAQLVGGSHGSFNYTLVNAGAVTKIP